MSLRIKLRSGEKVYVNGTVITNPSQKSIELQFASDALVLRESAIMKQEQANTPVKRIYFLAQMLYLNLGDKAQLKEQFYWHFSGLMEALENEEAKSILSNIALNASTGAWFNCMRKAHTLLDLEKTLLAGGDMTDSILE